MEEQTWWDGWLQEERTGLLAFRGEANRAAMPFFFRLGDIVAIVLSTTTLYALGTPRKTPRMSLTRDAKARPVNDEASIKDQINKVLSGPWNAESGAVERRW
jgi:hypothetical protein